MKDLFGNDHKPTNHKFSKLSPFQRLASLELLTAINPRKKWTKASISKHGQPIRLMQERDHVPADELDRVLEFHCENIRAKYQPQAFSGEAFRKKYERIRSAYQRHVPEIDEVDISERAIGITARLRMLGWRKGSLEKLPSEVQIGLNWCAKLKDKLKSLELAGAEGMCVRALLERLPSNWTEQHYSQAHKRLHNWEEWNGDMEFVRMDIENKDVWRVIVSNLEQYAGQRAGDQFSKKLKGLLREN